MKPRINHKSTKFTLFIITCLILTLPFHGCNQTGPQSEPAASLAPPTLPPENLPTEFPSPSDPTQPDALTDVVVKSDLIVLGTITGKRYDVVTIESGNVTGKFTYTIFTLSVEKVIKGDHATKQVFIKVVGGLEGTPGPLPPGPYFSITDRVLICLTKIEDNIYSPFSAFPFGLLWVESSVKPPPIVIRNDVKMDLERWIGELIVIMKANNIPIALPASEWPPLPAPVPVSPPKN